MIKHFIQAYEIRSDQMYIEEKTLMAEKLYAGHIGFVKMAFKDVVFTNNEAIVSRDEVKELAVNLPSLKSFVEEVLNFSDVENIQIVILDSLGVSCNG